MSNNRFSDGGGHRMSEPENFLARWSRLKREAALAQSDRAEHAPVAVPPVASASPVTAFDSGTLPPIELIDAATDIRPFLDASVPEDLTRAALRNTWSADPAIRDFIGIAENQWDFNDPASIPGFSVQAAVDYLCGTVAQDLANPNAPGDGPEASARVLERPVAQDSGCADSAAASVGYPAPAAATEGPLDANLGVPAGAANAAGRFTQQPASEGESGTPRARSHGAALPQ
jgi:hypothetical protein